MTRVVDPSHIAHPRRTLAQLRTRAAQAARSGQPGAAWAYRTLADDAEARVMARTDAIRAMLAETVTEETR